MRPGKIHRAGFKKGQISVASFGTDVKGLTRMLFTPKPLAARARAGTQPID